MVYTANNKVSMPSESQDLIILTFLFSTQYNVVMCYKL